VSGGAAEAAVTTFPTVCNPLPGGAEALSATDMANLSVRRG
jgi:hypothetical protein